MYCSREYNFTSRFNQQYEKSTSNSDLNSSAVLVFSFWQATSKDVIYSKMGGFLGVTAKFGPWANTSFCVGVSGTSDKFMTYCFLWCKVYSSF